MPILDDNAISLLLQNHPELLGKKIGLVFFNLPTNSMRAELCESISRRTGSYNLILFNTDYPTDSHSEEEIIRKAHETHDISGFIIWPSTNFDQHAGEYLEKKGIPFILIPHVSDIYQGRYNEVCTPIDATSLAIQHMVDQGATKIGFIIGEKTYNTIYVQQRYISYRNVLLENNLNVFEPVCLPDKPEEEAFLKYDADIIRNLNRFDGVFAATDFLMGLLYKRCIDSGLKIPKDFLLSSIDNTTLAQCLDVTSIEQNFPKIALRAVDLLVSLIINNNKERTQICIPSNLVVRSSTQARSK